MENRLETRPFTRNDYDMVMALWRGSDGVGLSSADTPEAIAAYLARNPGLSLTAWLEDRLVGAVLCGHDGRRGFIHHLAVHAGFRRRGVGRILATRCLENLGAAGIQKCHLFVFDLNETAVAFWQALGWEHRLDVRILSHYTMEAL